MKGQAYINDNDIWSTWGASLCSGAYEALLTPPPMKTYISNSSRLEHGERILTSSARTDSRELSISFFVEGSSQSDYLAKYESFVTMLTSGQIELKVTTLKKSYKLVYTSCSKYGDYGVRKGKFTVKFTEPNTNDRTDI